MFVNLNVVNCLGFVYEPPSLVWDIGRKTAARARVRPTSLDAARGFRRGFVVEGKLA